MEDRLSRVEKKIDSLQEAVISLARVEERLVTVFNRQSSIESKVPPLNKCKWNIFATNSHSIDLAS